MKQFCYDIGGRNSITFDLERALHHAAYASERLIMRGRFEALTVGETLIDVDGDVWTRLPDLEEPQTETRPASDVAGERLERIATHVFAAMVQTSPMVQAHVHAKVAMDYAKALIAELDKPA